MRPSALFRLGLSLIILAIHIQSGWARDNSSLVPRTSTIAPGPNVQFELQARLIDAVPGDVIQLKAGRYNLLKQLDVVTSKLTIRGEGSGKTVLSFKGQDSGGAGLNATGDNFTLESLAIEDTAGNAVKVLGADGVTLRDVRVEWTGPPRSSNGAYGLYPVQCQNVLIEECVAIGASDAGLYVGQCRNVIVRRSKAERNVAGIEIENSVNADVYENTAVNNTGGLLVFDLPGLQLKSGKNVRLFKNTVKDNNHKNFAAKGAMVASVPPGTGVMIMATDEVEVFDNEIHDHQTGGIAVLSFAITGKKINDATYDQFPESISIHDNRISNSGYDGRGELGLLLKPLLGGKLPDVLWDGVIDPKNQQDGKPTPQQIPSIVNNGKISFANFDFSNLAPQNVLLGKYKVRRDLNEHADVRKPLAAAVLSKPKPTPASATAAVLVYRSAKQKLSEYGLFEGDLAKQTPAKGVVPYELNTPLFSDYTTKYRFIRVPTGETIDYRDEGVLQFPVGTIIAKTFAYPHDMTDPSKGERLLETRIEMHRDEGWFGFSYLWDEQQTDATLVLGGAELDVTWKHTDGSQRSNQYQIPNANQCVTCHDLGDKFVPIGPVAANLNRSFDFGDGPENQLTHLKEQGMLTGTPEDLSAIHAWPEFNLPTSSDSHSNSVDDRARTWLHVNCAHCHSPGGTARTSGLDLRVSQTDAGKWGVWKTPVAAGHGTGGRSYDIVPGKPNESILLHRIESTDPSITMPSVAKRLVPVEAVSLIRQWIAGMEVEQN